MARELNEQSKSSVGVNALVLTPAFVGLGISGRNGFNFINSNKGSLSPVTGGKPDRLEMIGRNSAKSTNAIIDSALNQSKESLVKGLSELNSTNFVSRLSKKGPERNAIVAAYRAMLNSPYLGLSDVNINKEQELILMNSNSMTDDDFAKDMQSRIKKRMLEFGVDKQEEFVSEFQKELKQQLKLEKAVITGNAPKLDLQPSINTRKVSLKEVDTLSSNLKNRIQHNYKELTGMINEFHTTPNNSIDIFEVTDNRFNSKSFMARVALNLKGETVSFDIPLAAGRELGTSAGTMRLKTTGGIVYQAGKRNNYGKLNYASAVVSPSFLTNWDSRSETVETYFRKQFKQSLVEMKGAHERQYKDIAMSYVERTFGLGQRIAPVFNEAQLSNAALAAYRVVNKIEGFDPNSRLHNQRLEKNQWLKTTDVGYSQLSTGERLDINAPTIEMQQALFQPGDLMAKSKSSSIRKTNSILNRSKVLNPVLGWSDTDMLTYSAQNNEAEIMMGLNRDARRSRRVIYQISDTYAQRYSLEEGAYLGQSFNFRTNPQSLRSIDLSTNTPLLNYLISKKDANNQVFLTRKMLNQHGGLLGRHTSGTIASLPVDNFTTGMRVTLLPNQKDPNVLNLAYEVERRGGNYSKVRSLSLKGQILNTSKKVIAKEIAKNLGISLSEALKLADTTIIATDDQVKREVLSMRNQILSAFEDTMSRHLSKDEVSNLVNQIKREIQVNPNDNIGKTVTRIMYENGANPSEIAAVVAGYYQKWKNQLVTDLGDIPLDSDRLKSAFFNDFFNIGSGATNQSHQNVLKAIDTATSFYGFDTFSLDTINELQGAGRLASVERRTIHGMLQTLLSSGLNENEAQDQIANILSRTGRMSNPKHLLASQAFLSSALSIQGKSDISDASNLAKRLGLSFTTGKGSLKALQFLPGTRAAQEATEAVYKQFMTDFKGSTMFSLSLDSEAAREAVRRLGGDFFKGNEIIIPGVQGFNALRDLTIKQKGQKIPVGSQYESQVNKIVQMARDPNTKSDQLEIELKNLRKIIFTVSAESRKVMGTGKVAGSSFGRAWSLNKLQFSERNYERMMKHTMADGGQTIFSTDRAFWNIINSQKRFLKSSGQLDDKEAGNLARRVEQFFFNTQSDGLYGYFGRFPTLGEGHSQLTTMRRAIDPRQNSSLLKMKTVRSFLEREFGKSDKETLINFLNKNRKDAGGNRVAFGSAAQRRSFSELLLKGSGRLNNIGEATFFTPIMQLDFNVNGMKVVEEFSKHTSMFADLDGDNTFFIMAAGNTKPIRKNLSSEAVKNMYRSNVEFSAMKKQIKNHQDSKVFKNTLSLGEQITEDVLKIVHSKNVQKFSTALDALKVATLSAGRDEKSNRLAMQSLVLLEEMMLKSKKQSRALDVANEVAEAIFKDDKETFMSAIREHIVPENQSKLHIEYNIPGFKETQISDIDHNELFDYIWNNYQTVKKSGGLDLRSINTIVNKYEFPTDNENRTAAQLNRLVSNLNAGTGGLIQGAGAEMAGVINKQSIAESSGHMAKSLLSNIEDTISSSTFRSKIALPALIGIGSAIALSRGFEHKESPQFVSVNMGNSMAAQDIETGISSNEPQQSQYVNRGNIINNDLYLSDQVGSRVETVYNGLYNIEPIRNTISQLGFSNNNVFIQDNRKPITKNYIDKIKEQ